MILINELKGKMKSKEITQAEMAQKIGISLKTFNTKLNRGVFNSNEISVMINVLDIDNAQEIFFASEVTY